MTDTDWDDFHRRIRENDARRDQLRPEFERIGPMMTLHEFGLGVPAFRRAQEAVAVAREFRRLNTNGGDLTNYEPTCLIIRVAADQFAYEIDEHARECDLDPATVRIITAGLRCPRRPYCTGCPRCQTITAPTRENTELKVMWR